MFLFWLKTQDHLCSFETPCEWTVFVKLNEVMGSRDLEKIPIGVVSTSAQVQRVSLVAVSICVEVRLFLVCGILK